MGEKKKKPKAVNVQVIPRELAAGGVHESYLMMDRIVAEHHEHLIEANIALAWNLSWSADPDGRLILGKCKKVDDLGRQLHGFDFVILLNKDAWAEMDTAMRRALLDHELCHAQVKLDKNEDIVHDENGKIVYRCRKHDLEEFRDIVRRHGMWDDGIRDFVREAVRSSNEPLLKIAAALEDGGATVQAGRPHHKTGT